MANPLGTTPAKRRWAGFVSADQRMDLQWGDAIRPACGTRFRPAEVSGPELVDLAKCDGAVTA